MAREEDIYDFVVKPVERFQSVFNCEIDTELAILDECFYKVEESLSKYFDSSEAKEGYDPSPYKIAGVVCFWLRKLKPFSVPEDAAKHIYVNEIIAFLTGYYLVFGFQVGHKEVHKPKITSKYFSDIVCSYRYNSHSPHSSALIFESLCI